jgi:hypothetical protein
VSDEGLQDSSDLLLLVSEAVWRTHLIDQVTGRLCNRCLMPSKKNSLAKNGDIVALFESVVSGTGGFMRNAPPRSAGYWWLASALPSISRSSRLPCKGRMTETRQRLRCATGMGTAGGRLTAHDLQLHLWQPLVVFLGACWVRLPRSYSSPAHIWIGEFQIYSLVTGVTER